MKTTLKALLIFTAATIVLPFSLAARELSIEQVKQNVLNLQKAVMDGQPAVTAREFKKISEGKDEFVLLDVRSEAEFNAAHLPGALNIERGRLEWLVPNIIKNTERIIYVYCQEGRRSAFATERLIQMGYTNAVHIVDGLEAWLNAGYHVYNMHGEFIVTTGGFQKREPAIGNIGR